MPTITQQYWTYFWSMVEEYLPILQAQASFLKLSKGISPWFAHPIEPIPGVRETMWENIPWTPQASPNHLYSRTLKNKTTMLSAFISYLDQPDDFPLDGSDIESMTVGLLAQELLSFIVFLFFTNKGVREQSQQDEIARKEMIIKLAEEWLYKSPMSVEQGVDVIISPGGYSPLADDPSDFQMGQLLIEMSNPGGASDSSLDETEFVVLVDEEAPDIMQVFESLLENDIWACSQTQHELEMGWDHQTQMPAKGAPHTSNSLVDTCCGCPLMLYMMILFLIEIGFNKTIGTPFLHDSSPDPVLSKMGVVIPFPHPAISQELNWNNLMDLFEDGDFWRVVINRQNPNPQP